jgi:hypothetical protein
MTENTEAGTIAALAAKASGAHVVKTADKREFLIVPSGFTDKEVSDAYGLKLAKPKYIKQTVTIETADSLVDYVNRFKGVSTMLFAEISSNRIVALIDYHVQSGKLCPRARPSTSPTRPSWSFPSPKNGCSGPRSAGR